MVFSCRPAGALFEWLFVFRLCGTSEPRRGDGIIRQVVSTPAEKTTKTNGNPEGVIGSQSSCLGVVSIGSASSQAASSLCFRSLIRLITLSKMAQSAKNATTPTIQTTNNSVTILLNLRVQRYEIGAVLINKGVKKVARFKKFPIFAPLIQTTTL